MEVLEDYARVSGQEVNFSKSCILFSGNVDLNQQTRVKDLLGIHNSMEEASYLGLPIVIGCSRVASLSFIKDRFRKKLSTWKGKFLNAAGKDVLIKSVLQSIPTYLFSIFKFPRSLCVELESICGKFFWGSTKESRKIHWTAWNKLCFSKANGGLGFRRVEAFNLALLAKQGWRLLSEPSALMCSMLKEKYYPRTHFMKATKSANASFLWTGLLEARRVLNEGGRWRVGDGFDISIFSDRWFHNQTEILSVDTLLGDYSGTKVYELIDDQQRLWKADLVHQVFMDEVAKRILATPLAATKADDRWLWCWTKNGVYNVKSGYYVAEKLLFGLQHNLLEREELWAKLWNLKVLPKLRFFAWRLVSGTLASKASLLSKGIMVSSVCETCGVENENFLHIFRDCKWSKDLWRQFPSVDTMEHLSDFISWLEGMYASLDNESLCLFVNVCWWIWKNRNMCVFDGICAKVDVYGGMIRLWIEAQHVREEAARGSNESVSTPVVQVWNAPMVGVVKINFDASFVKESLRSYYGCIARDYEGNVLEAECGFSGTVETVIHAETMAVKKAILMASRLGVQQVQLEGDNLELIMELNSQNISYMGCGALIDEIKEYASASSFSVSFLHIRRNGNRAAHCLAGLSIFSLFSWNNLQPEVEDVVLLDKSHYQ